MNEYTTYKNFALEAAKDLGYSKKIIKQIRECNDDNEISKIMSKARREMESED